ncbi:Non-Homologous End-Joining Factor 1 [Manis pentadactyla]|nr:Non-Homologous End-Joining Factor 1 [Manis pentadactyla]
MNSSLHDEQAISLSASLELLPTPKENRSHRTIGLIVLRHLSTISPEAHHVETHTIILGLLQLIMSSTIRPKPIVSDRNQAWTSRVQTSFTLTHRIRITNRSFISPTGTFLLYGEEF